MTSDEPDISPPGSPPAPPGTRLRRATWDDVGRVADLYTSHARDRAAGPAVSPEDVEQRWRATDRLDDTLLVEDADGRLLAFGEFHEDRVPWSDDVELYLDARVHPSATGRGLGTFLLARAEARARRAGDGPLPLRTTLADADDRGRALFERLGFRPVRHFLDLRIDLDAAPPAPRWPEGVRGRGVDLATEARPLWATLQAAFADHWAYQPTSFEDWHYLTIERESDDGAHWQVAEDDRGLVGVAVVRARMPDDPALGYVRDLGVVQRARGAGVALALLRAVFVDLHAAGVRRVGLEVDDITLHGALRLYQRAGMQVARRTDVYEKVLHD